jgi:Voltage gated chloride channel
LQTLNIRQEPRRAAVAGAIAGFLVGITGMLVPHTLFWGEAQLQNLIDKGRSPLPIFGRGDDPTADLTAWAFCLLDPDKGRSRYSLGCSALIGASKILTTGLSLGTGIIGGHFWGPLFTGCIASHFFTDFADMVGKNFGVNPIVGTYPCVAILCTMGASHVVTFRAHTSIMLILTLTISAFTPEDATAGFAAGNYSAVFPLLVVAVYVSLMISRDFVKFYPAQRCRGDIMALPEALCEPGKAGAPMFTYYSDDEDESHITGSHSGSSDAEDSDELSNEGGNEDRGKIHSRTNAFESIDHVDNDANKADTWNVPEQETDHVDLYGDNKTEFPTGMSSSRLDRLLSAPLPERVPIKAQQNHRRVRSACESQALAVDLAAPSPGHRRSRTTHSPGVHSPGSSSESGRDLGRVYSFGEILDFQPSLLDQARARASSRHHVSSRRARSHPKSPAHTHSPGRTVD